MSDHDHELQVLYMRELREKLWWQTYNVVLQAILPPMLEISNDRIDIDLERAHRVALAAAERAHGALEMIRGLR